LDVLKTSLLEKIASVFTSASGKPISV